MNDLLTVKDVAKLLGLSTNTVYKYVNSGLIRSSRAQLKQGRFRVSKKAVEEFIGTTLDEVQPTPQEKPVIQAQETVVVLNETPQSGDTDILSKKYDQLIKSLIEENNPQRPAESQTQPKNDVSAAMHEETNGAQSSAATQTYSAPHVESKVEPTAQPVKPTATVKPSFSLKASRLVLLLAVALFVMNIAYFSPLHPLALFSQFSILFLFILLSYQYGGVRKRVA